MTRPINSNPDRDPFSFYYPLHSAEDSRNVHPLGLSPDSSISSLEDPQEEEPPIVRMAEPRMSIRPFYWVALLFVGAVALTIGAVRRAVLTIFGYTAYSKARKQFAEDLKDKDPDVAAIVMQQLVQESPLLAPAALVGFLCDKNRLAHIKEIMQGANVLIEGQSSELFTMLTQLEGAQPRRSSHPHQQGTSYGVATHLFGELLFWNDKEGYLRLQFEAHPLTSVYHFLSHAADFLRYRLTGAQQGPYGSSLHTELAPLTITFD